MKTKEEIARYYGLCTCDEIYTSRKMVAPDCPWHSLGVEEAMDDYAKQMAIAFAIRYATSVLTWANTKKPEEVAEDRMEVRYKWFLKEAMKTKDLPNGACVIDTKFNFRFFKDPHHWYSPNGDTLSFDEMDEKLKDARYQLIHTPFVDQSTQP